MWACHAHDERTHAAKAAHMKMARETPAHGTHPPPCASHAPLRAHDRLDAVGDEVARLQREGHAVGAHGDPVRDADRVEPKPDHARVGDAGLDLGGEVQEVHVAGVALVPDRRNPDLDRGAGVGWASVHFRVRSVCAVYVCLCACACVAKGAVCVGACVRVCVSTAPVGRRRSFECRSVACSGCVHARARTHGAPAAARHTSIHCIRAKLTLVQHRVCGVPRA